MCPSVTALKKSTSVSLRYISLAGLGFNTGAQGLRPEGNANGGGSPCRKHSRCSACSCLTCDGAVGEGRGPTGGGPSLTWIERGSTAEPAWGLKPAPAPLEHRRVRRSRPLGSRCPW